MEVASPRQERTSGDLGDPFVVRQSTVLYTKEVQSAKEP